MSNALLEPSTQQDHVSDVTGTMQLVSFHLSEETFGVAITKVREIILMCGITQIPQTPHYVKGLIDLRSSVIPVIDLRTLFGLPENGQTGDSRIMVLQVGSRTVGIIVDAVDEVLRISQEQIAPPPPTVAGLGNEYLNGLVKLDEQLLILLDIDKILGQEEESLANAVAETT